MLKKDLVHREWAKLNEYTVSILRGRDYCYYASFEIGSKGLQLYPFTTVQEAANFLEKAGVDVTEDNLFADDQLLTDVTLLIPYYTSIMVLMPPDIGHESNVEFNRSALEMVTTFGYHYFVVLTDVNNDYALQLFPFKTLERANIFMAEYGYLGSHLHYILDDSDVLEQLADGGMLIRATISLNF